MIKVICFNCKKEFQKYPCHVKKRNFCDKKCYQKNRSILLKSGIYKNNLPDVKGKNNGMYGKKHSEETKKKIGLKSIGRKPMLGKIFSSEHKKKIGKSKIGNNYKKGKLHSDESKYKQRLSAINRIKNQFIQNNKIFRTTIGRNETQILNELELSLNKKIIRQYFTKGYFVDGYCKDLNLIIEVDEKGHNYIKEQDKIRENNIKKELNCTFIRIKDNFNR